jgi:hypothetical protein
MHKRLLRTWLCLVAAVLVVGCATSSNQSATWRDPDYQGPQFTKVFVVAMSATSLADQRSFEDLMVSMLHTTGIVAVPAWQFIPTGRTPDPATIRAAISQSGADAVLLVRPSGITTDNAVPIAQGPVIVDMYTGWYQSFVLFADVPVGTIYTTLFNARTSRPVWTFNPSTYGQATLRQAAPDFASDVAGRLQSSGLVATL